MSNELTERGIGLELVEREACLILFNELNDELDSQQAIWADRDTEFAQTTGLEPSYVNLEHIDPENFYYGHQPSLIEASVDKYPNVCTMAQQAGPAATNDIIDQTENFLVNLDIESFVKSEDSASEVNRRMRRTVEAINQVLVRNENLNGLSLGYNNDPDIIITDAFKRDEQTSHGPVWFWQAARLRYNLTRHVRLP